MQFRFNLGFVKVDSRQWLELRRSYPASVSPWTAAPYAVSSVDYLKNNLPAIQAAPPFDLVIIDEAHHVARAFAGEGRSSATDRSRLARVLADHTRELSCCRLPRTTVTRNHSPACCSCCPRISPLSRQAKPGHGAALRRAAAERRCGAR